ncbi:hypothetical protein VE25_01435 [Devosia geojensis]|uniref:YCII-related domain-containing protein n=1 Tax=Devosia geojensis TaxID=443610 RepID=A0A0F5FZB5_9HYPH|nr:YciI family protein [Devosia geojensis]KKB13522.1 hypothetical protein VE25_01435 [Devosia geojensis]
MRYMMLIHNDDEAYATAPQEVYAEWAAFNEALNKADAVPGLRLKEASAATTVRSRNGKTDVLDGPYIEAREQLAGYFIIDVPSLDEAIAWAQRCPSVKYGSIEIRPIVDPHS